MFFNNARKRRTMDHYVGLFCNWASLWAKNRQQRERKSPLIVLRLLPKYDCHPSFAKPGIWRPSSNQSIYFWCLDWVFYFWSLDCFKSGFGTHVAVDLCQVAFFFPFTHSFPPHRRIPTSSCACIIFPLHHGVTGPPPPPLLVPPPTRRHPHRLPPPVRRDRRRLTEVPKSSWTRARTRPLWQ